jgi:hypothetical protein
MISSPAHPGTESRRFRGISALEALDVYICKNIICTKRKTQKQLAFRPMKGFATAPTAVEVSAALEWLLARVGLPPGQYVRISPIPVGLGLMYRVEVSASAEPALSKALLAILGYRIQVNGGSFCLYQIEAQLVAGATKRSDVA